MYHGQAMNQYLALQVQSILLVSRKSMMYITRKRFSSCRRHVSSSTFFSSLSFASLSAPVSFEALKKIGKCTSVEY